MVTILKKKANKVLMGLLLIGFSIGVGVLAYPQVAERIFIGEDEEATHTSDAIITADEATTIAEQRLGGVALSVGLENEDGYLVYGVIIETPTGCYDVKIDAGTGEFLKADPDGPDSLESSTGEDFAKDIIAALHLPT